MYGKRETKDQTTNSFWWVSVNHHSKWPSGCYYVLHHLLPFMKLKIG